MLRFITYLLLIINLNITLPVSAQTSPSSEKKKTAPGDVKVINGSYEHRSNGTTTIINTDDNGSKYRIIVEGSLSIADDEKSITGLSSGGRFEYSRQQVGEAEHKVVVKSKNDGQLEGQYWVDDVAKDYATEGKAWLAQYLPEMITKTGIGAEARTERLFTEGGAAKVLAFTGSMKGGAGRTKMYRYLLAKETLTPKDLQTVMEQLVEVKSSDYELASVLMRVPASALMKPEMATAYLKAASSIHSDYEKGRTLKHMLTQEQLPESVLNEVAKSIVTIQSDYEKARVLSVLIARPKISDQQFVFAMQALEKIGSDYERAKALTAVMRHDQQVKKQFASFMPLIKGIASDYEKSKVYTKLLTIKGLSADEYVALLKDSEKISSDYEKSKLLQKIAKQMPVEDKDVRQAYIQTAKTISSSNEYEKVTAIYKQ